MASTQALAAAAQDRKARLAQLKSLKRKQPSDTSPTQQDEAVAPAPKSPRKTAEDKDDVTSIYLSGRNYDLETRETKLGFEVAPSEGKETLEKKAAELALEAKRQQEEEAKDDKPLDLFKLQPKKPNWDLKRDLERKLEVLHVRTNNAIAKIVRERIAEQQKAAKARQSNTTNNGNANGSTDGEGEGEAVVGIEGATLVEAANIREREEQEELRREREEEEALLDGS
jgi:coiled-coil domain-containing protein 12